MTAKKGKVLAVIVGIIIYAILLLIGILNLYPTSFIIRNFFIAPVLTLAVVFVVWMILPNGGVKTIPNDQEISWARFLSWIIVPITLGGIAMFYVVKGDYVEIDWIIFPLVLSIGLICRDLIEGRN